MHLFDAALRPSRARERQRSSPLSSPKTRRPRRLRPGFTTGPSDAGASWNKVLASPVTSVAFDGRGSVYAGMARDPGVRENILARSSDGGRTWTNVILPPNPDTTSRTQANWVSMVAGGDTLSLVVSHESPTPGLSQLDFYRSTDAGNSWSTAGSGISPTRRPGEVTSTAFPALIVRASHARTRVRSMGGLKGFAR